MWYRRNRVADVTIERGADDARQRPGGEQRVLRGPKVDELHMVQL